jgi:hypothetical protein
VSRETAALRVRPGKAERGDTVLLGSIIHGGHEHHAGDKVPEGADLDRLKRLGLVGESKPKAKPQAVEHAHGDSKHKHPVAFADLSTSALAGLAKQHSLEVDTSGDDEAKVRADLLDALAAAHPPQ